jgi:hypothetical protein
MSLMTAPVKMTSFGYRTLRRLALRGVLDFSLRFHRHSQSLRSLLTSQAGRAMQRPPEYAKSAAPRAFFVRHEPAEAAMALPNHDRLKPGERQSFA